jgi:steroid delta-isomerase-like uncharacterized protein
MRTTSARGATPQPGSPGRHLMESDAMSAEITQMMRDLIAAWNDHDVERAAQFYAEDYHGTDVGQSGPQIGRASRVRVLEAYIRAFPDLQFTGDSIVEGDRAVLIWTMTGTHRGPVYRIPPTGRQIEVRGVSILTVAGGKITRGHNIWDTAGLLRALKLLPEL